MTDCHRLVSMLRGSTRRNCSEALMLSGGLDSSVLAALARPNYSITIAYGASAPDVDYARKVAASLDLNHVLLILNDDAILELAESVIRELSTFDPMEVRNSIVALAGIRQAKSDGFSNIMTGDGCDELFAGYNYLSRYYGNLAKLESELERLWSVMHFSSKSLAVSEQMQVMTPFLDTEFASYAKSIPVSLKIGEYNNRTYGKFILRNCFAGKLGDLVWREKMAQEAGAGVQRIEKLVDKILDNGKFQDHLHNAVQEQVQLRSREHAFYYTIFRKYYPRPSQEKCALRCPSCHGCFRLQGRFCRICGAFPVDPISL